MQGCMVLGRKTCSLSLFSMRLQSPPSGHTCPAPLTRIPARRRLAAVAAAQRNLWIGNLVSHPSERTLEQVFSRFGKIERVKGEWRVASAGLYLVGALQLLLAVCSAGQRPGSSGALVFSAQHASHFAGEQD